MRLKLLVLLCLLLLSGGCSFHADQFSYFNMLDDEKRTLQNREAAQKFWSTVRRIDTISASHYKLGRYYQQQGKYDKAIVEFSKALANDKAFCKAYNGMAMSYDALKQCKIAHSVYKKAIQCDSQQAYIYNNFACSSLLCGEYQQGIDLLRKAEALSKENTRIRNNLKLAHAAAQRDNTVNSSPRLDMQSLTVAEKILAPQPDKNIIASRNQFTGRSEPATRDDRANHLPSKIADGLALTAGTGETGDKTKISLAPEPTIKIDVRSSKAASLNFTNVAFEVSNGNGVTGMAGRSADYLRDNGFSIRRITNADHFQFAESIIYYRKGYLQAAQKLAGAIPGAQDLKEVDDLGRSYIGVRLLLGRDLVKMHFPDDYYYKQLALAKI